VVTWLAGHLGAGLERAAHSVLDVIERQISDHS